MVYMYMYMRDVYNGTCNVAYSLQRSRHFDIIFYFDGLQEIQVHVCSYSSEPSIFYGVWLVWFIIDH